MQVYAPPLEDITFLLETYDYEGLTAFNGYEDFDLATAKSIIEEYAKFCVQELLPLNRLGDKEGVEFDPETGAVKTATGFKEAYAAFCENGYPALCHDPEYGGTGAPLMLGFLIGEIATATNKSWGMAPSLNNGLIEALTHYGSKEQQETYLEKLISGEWTGTMCLTEPQCGTDLGLVSTKASPADGAYRLSGTKIWITFGEHDYSQNIIHLVLARLPDAPPGIKGISTFIVPKLLEDGSRNGVRCTGVDHKLGINASPTCVINLEDSIGYLVGEPHRGMRTMFVMMNTARLAVGVEGYALSEIAYQNAVSFAQDRRQMRALDKAKRDEDHEADCILVHPDVRRMLLNIRSTTEGMRALGAYLAKRVDLSIKHPEAEQRQRADDLVALLTPVVKSYFTERGFQNVSDAMQVCGGAGYTEDWPIEQYLRDLRIAMIYEGTNHIQALDLVGRKLPLDSGRLVQVFAEEVTQTLRSCKEDPRLAEFVEGLKQASKTLNGLTMSLAAKGMADPEEAGAAASNYLNVFALTALALVWCQMAKACVDREDAFAVTKLKVGRYFVHNVLPEIDSLVRIIEAGKEHMMTLTQDEF